MTIDCSGFTVNYSSSSTGYGVQSNSSNTTVKNCRINQTTLQGYSYAVYFTGAKNATINNNTVRTLGTWTNYDYAVSLDAFSDGANVSSNNITGGAAGVVVSQSNNASISGNNVTATVFAVLVERYANGTVVYANNLTSTGNDAVLVDGEYGGTLNTNITGNAISSFGAQGNSPGSGLPKAGVRVTDECNYTAISNNTISASLGYGVSIYTSIENDTTTASITGNNITAGTDGGIGVDSWSISFLNVSYNNVYVPSAGSYGLYLEYNMYNATVSSNNVTCDGNAGSWYMCMETDWLINGTVSHNNVTMSGGWGSVGLEIMYVDEYASIHDNVVTASGDGIEGFEFFGSGGATGNDVYRNNVTVVGNDAYGFYLRGVVNNSFYNNRIVTSGTNTPGMFFRSSFASGSDNNTFTGETINASASGDLLITESAGNVFYNATLGSAHPVNVSFTYYGDFEVDGVESSIPSDPTGYSNVSKYVNVTNQSAGAWVFLNVSYADADVPTGFNASNVTVFRYSGGAWAQVAGSGANRGAPWNYSHANLTAFSDFAPMAGSGGANATPTPAPTSTPSGGGSTPTPSASPTPSVTPSPTPAADYVTAVQYAPPDSFETAETAVVFSVGCAASQPIDALQIWTNLSSVWNASYSNASYANGSVWNQNASGLSAGQYEWAVYCNDSANSSWTAIRTFYVNAAPSVPTPGPSEPTAPPSLNHNVFVDSEVSAAEGAVSSCNSTICRAGETADVVVRRTIEIVQAQGARTSGGAQAQAGVVQTRVTLRVSNEGKATAFGVSVSEPVDGFAKGARVDYSVAPDRLSSGRAEWVISVLPPGAERVFSYSVSRRASQSEISDAQPPMIFVKSAASTAAWFDWLLLYAALASFAASLAARFFERRKNEEENEESEAQRESNEARREGNGERSGKNARF